MNTLKLVEEDGTSVEFSPHDAKRFDVEPLDFTQLVQAVVTPNPTLSLTIRNAQASRESTGLDSDGPLTIHTAIAHTGPVLAYGLVNGGWLPLPWAHKRVAWLDRNVVIALEKLQKEGREAHGHGDPGWLSKVLGLDTEHVSPIPFLLEGRRQRPPSDFEMRAEVGRATRILEASLPGAKIQRIGTQQRRALLRYVLEHSQGLARSTQLLVRAAPLVAVRAKPSNRLRLEREVVEFARAAGVPTMSLPVLALFSCIYDDSDDLPSHKVAKPGRAVLKPSMSFNEADAYNALSDMSFIELMFNAHAMTPDVEPVLYTRDVGIASFWTALQASDQVMKNLGGGQASTTVTFKLTRDLFPALTGEQVLDLRARLSAYAASSAG